MAEEALLNTSEEQSSILTVKDALGNLKPKVETVETHRDSRRGGIKLTRENDNEGDNANNEEQIKVSRRNKLSIRQYFKLKSKHQFRSRITILRENAEKKRHT